MFRPCYVCFAFSIAALWQNHLLAADELAIPDTTAGRRAAAFVEAFSSGDEDAMRAFESEHRAVSALKMRSIDQRIDQYRDLFRQWVRLPMRECGSGW